MRFSNVSPVAHKGISNTYVAQIERSYGIRTVVVKEESVSVLSRELAVSKLANMFFRSLGAPVYEVTVDDNGDAVGIQDFLEGTVNYGEYIRNIDCDVNGEYIPHCDVKIDRHNQLDIMVLDYLICNTDRHDNNLMIDPITGHVYPIDHGFTLQYDEEWYSCFGYINNTNDLSADDKDYIRDRLYGIAINSELARDMILNSGLSARECRMFFRNLNTLMALVKRP